MTINNGGIRAERPGETLIDFCEAETTAQQRTAIQRGLSSVGL
jgi:hypothetical protein